MLTMRGNRKSSSSLSTGGSVNFTRALKSSIYNHHSQWQCHHYHLSTPFQQYLIEWCFLHGIFITIILTIMVATLVELRRLMRKCPIEDCKEAPKLSIQSISKYTEHSNAVIIICINTPWNSKYSEKSSEASGKIVCLFFPMLRYFRFWMSII